ncbi:MAG: acetyl-CoA carboxylase, biotin carboxyl carrier protein, partial [Puniceicoccales bacterium]|nr:acetyl-CoA carboxylase, biotin carboxyl carrier protein [Puniceicoccales bacterium]
PLPVKPVEEKGIHYIKSPTVGTFYAFPNPDSQPFVKQGDIVKSDTVVCIIEAMKVMNEVHAECGGEILEVLARNGCPVEYGQALFKVKLDTV